MLIQLIPRLGIHSSMPGVQSPRKGKAIPSPFCYWYLLPCVSQQKIKMHTKHKEIMSSSFRRTPIKLHSAAESSRESKTCICYCCCSWRCELRRRFARLLTLWANQKGERWTYAKAWAVSKCSNLCRTRRSQSAAGPATSETEGTLLTSIKLPDRKKRLGC